MNGLNDFAENPELRQGLREPFKPHLISKLPRTAKRPELDYVNHAVVTDRLNAVAPGWTMSEPQILGFTGSDGLPHCMGVLASMTIGSVTRWEVGEADGLDAYGREVKGAISDFIRRAAMRFGVALDLWTKADLSSELQASEGTDANTHGRPTQVTPDVESGPSSVADIAPSEVSAGSPAAPEGVGSDQVVTIAYGEGATDTEETDPTPSSDRIATDEQWRRLIETTGSTQKAVNRINQKNGTSYTRATAQEGATWDELVKAMT